MYCGPAASIARENPIRPPPISCSHSTSGRVSSSITESGEPVANTRIEETRSREHNTAQSASAFEMNRPLITLWGSGVAKFCGTVQPRLRSLATIDGGRFRNLSGGSRTVGSSPLVRRYRTGILSGCLTRNPRRLLARAGGDHQDRYDADGDDGARH